LLYNKGYFRDYIDKLTEIKLEIVKRSDDKKEFQILPWRWIVERTFAWLGKFRRLSKDYELLPKNSESFIYLAMIKIMVRRLSIL
jgi:putative transposase